MDKELAKKLVDRFFKQSYDAQDSQGCAEPGYSDQPVIMANWNNIPSFYSDAFEKIGYSVEWEDEWLVCDECYKAFRCSPDSYGWEMFGYTADGFCVCGNCIDWDEYLESLENQPRKAVTRALFDKFEEQITDRYELVKDGFENGFYEGQNDNPQTILEALLEKSPAGRFLFVITDQGQFDIDFSVYRKIEEEESEESEEN